MHLSLSTTTIPSSRLVVAPLGHTFSHSGDSEGHTTELGELIADDKAMDLDAWVSNSTWEIGYPRRLVDIAYRLKAGIALTVADRKYLCKWRKREQKTLLGGNDLSPFRQLI